MEQNESNPSTKFAEETAQKKALRRRTREEILKEMNEQTTEDDDLLDFDVEKDGYVNISLLWLSSDELIRQFLLA